MGNAVDMDGNEMQTAENAAMVNAHFVAPELNRFLLGGVMVCQRYQTKGNDKSLTGFCYCANPHSIQATGEFGEHLTSLRLLLHYLKTSLDSN